MKDALIAFYHNFLDVNRGKQKLSIYTQLIKLTLRFSTMSLLQFRSKKLFNLIALLNCHLR